MKSATNKVLGCVYMEKGEPICSTFAPVHDHNAVRHSEGSLVMGDVEARYVELLLNLAYFCPHVCAASHQGLTEVRP